MRWSLAGLLLAVAGCGGPELPAAMSAQQVRADPAAYAADRYLRAGAEGDLGTACALQTPEKLVEQGGDGTIETCVAQGEALDAEIRRSTEEIFAAGRHHPRRARRRAHTDRPVRDRPRAGLRVRRAGPRRQARPADDGALRRRVAPRRVRHRRRRQLSARSMSSASAGCAYGPFPRSCASTLRWDAASLSWLILTLQTKRVIGSADADGAGRDLVRDLALEVHGLLDVLLEVGDEPGERRDVVLEAQDLRHAVAVGDAEVPRGRANRAGRVPARRHVAVRAGDDQQHLTVPEPVDLLVGPADVGDDRELLGGLVEQDRVVRGDELTGVLGDDRRPRVLGDQPPDDRLVRDRVLRVVAHDFSLGGSGGCGSRR